MKKKLMVGMLLASTLLIHVPVYAVSEELATLSVEELIEMRDEINMLIAEKSGENVIGQGTYEVGVDIATGYYKIVCAKGTEYGFLNVFVYENQEKYAADERDSVCSIYYNEEDPAASESTTINLVEGNVLKLTAEGVIEKINPAWAP